MGIVNTTPAEMAPLCDVLIAPLVGPEVIGGSTRMKAGTAQKLVLNMLTTMAMVSTCSMFLIRDEPGYFFAGLTLLAATATCGDLAGVPYNAMLRQLTTPQNSGRISGFGLAAAFVGSVGLLLLVYFGCIDGKGPTRGFLHLPTGRRITQVIAQVLADHAARPAP